MTEKQPIFKAFGKFFFGFLSSPVTKFKLFLFYNEIHVFVQIINKKIF